MRAWRAPLAALLLALAGTAIAADDAVRQREGRALFRGEAAFARPATVQGVALPGAACRACHGPRGEARSEAGVRVPPIHGQALGQPREGRAAYADGAAVLRALEHGVGRENEPLQPPMPRYAFTPREQQALLAYLRVLGTEAEPVPGLAPGRVRVASVLPLSGPQAAVGERIRAALAARFDAVNAAGGVFGRRIELQVVDAGADAASASRATRAALQEEGEGVFAFVGSLLPEPDAALRELLRSRDVPMVATLGVPRGEATQAQLSYLLPSIAAQVRQLVAELSRRCGTPTGVAVVLHPPGAALAIALAEAGPAWQLRSVADDGELAAAAREAAPFPLVALLAPQSVARVRAALQAHGPAACLGTLAVVSGTEAAGATGTLTEAVALPMPPLAGEAGGALWSTLGDTAARVFAEAFARTGRGVDSAGFARALDTLHHFEPGHGLAVTFSPSRRHGFEIAYLWTENSHAPTPR